MVINIKGIIPRLIKKEQIDRRPKLKKFLHIVSYSSMVGIVTTTLFLLQYLLFFVFPSLQKISLATDIGFLLVSFAFAIVFVKYETPYED